MVREACSPIGPNLGAAVPGFGTDGIRGRAGTVLTPALCLQVGYWMGQVLQQEGPVLIGMDSRSSGSMLVAALTAGLTAAGRDVWTLGLCPTPAVPLLIRQLGAAGGLMVSASHNPPADNGIKVFGADGAKLQRLPPGPDRSRSAGADAASEQATSHAAVWRDPAARSPGWLQRGVAASVAELRLDGVPIVLDLCWGIRDGNGADAFRPWGLISPCSMGNPMAPASTWLAGQPIWNRCNGL